VGEALLPKLLRKCANCGRYTMKTDACPYCKGKLTMPYPPKFSPQDKYGEYRRRYKMERATELATQKESETPENDR
jgi:H/ACA ribonucleoprotein complex subunit 3